MQLGTADTHVGGEALDVEVGVRQVGVDGFHDALHQSVVVAFHLDVLYLVLLSLCTGEFASQAAHIVDEVVDEDVQFLHVEGFG